MVTLRKLNGAALGVNSKFLQSDGQHYGILAKERLHLGQAAKSFMGAPNTYLSH
jgi:hypothetical protein